MNFQRERMYIIYFTRARAHASFAKRSLNCEHKKIGNLKLDGLRCALFYFFNERFEFNQRLISTPTFDDGR